MDILQIIVLAIVQGFTEFLPVSSSAHLILVPAFTQWADQGQAFDVALHIGSLMAVVAYFRTDLKNMIIAWLSSLQTRRQTPDSRLAWAVIFATIPAGLVGLIFKDYIELNLRGAEVIATTTIIFGLLLWFADWIGKRNRDEHAMTWKDVLIIGCAQAIALIPGTSLSGITMTAALMMGLTRSAAARFSFLLSVPIILLSGGLKTIDLIRSSTPVDWNALLAGTVLSALSAYLCIHLFLKLLEKVGMLPFVVYRLFLGLFIFAGIYLWGMDFSVTA
jgi:undecaprenyl-diphosphatase